MRHIILLLLGLLALTAHAQNVRVINQGNLKPIEHVFIYNLAGTASELTDEKGMAALESFSEEDVIVFQHPSYFEFIIPVKNLERVNFLIKLREKHVDLHEVVISASKWEQDKREVPLKITNITPRHSSIYNVQTAADLLGTSNEVYIQKSQYGGGSPMIRGFAANAVLIVVDGVRMNNAIFRSGNLQNVINIDPNSIESAEVIFGPGSIIYGSDALGGVMDFHTRQVRLSYDKKPNIQSSALIRYASASNENTMHLDLNYGREKWGFFTSLSVFNYDDLRMGSNTNAAFQRKEYVERIDGRDSVIVNKNPDIQKFSGYKQVNILQKFRFKPNKNLDMGYTVNFSTTSDIPRYDRLIEYKGEHLKYASWYYGPQQWMMHQLNANLTHQSGLFNNARFIVAYQYFKESRNDRKFQKDILRKRTEKVDAWSANLDFDKKIGNTQTLFYGLEAVYNFVGSDGVEENILTHEEGPIASRYPDGGSHYLSLAAYASYKNNLGQRTTLTAGIRYSYFYLDSKFDQVFYDFPYSSIQLDHGALIGSAGLVFRPEEGWQINVNASTGFRSPNIDDLAKIFDSEPGNVIVPNPNLKPEYAYNTDLGLIRQFSDKASIEITLFHTWLQHAMVRKEFTFNGQDSIMYDGELSRVWALQNIGAATIYGGSLALRWSLNSNFSIDSYLTLQKGKDKDGTPLRHVPPLFGSTGLTFDNEQVTIRLYFNYNGQISYQNLALSERNKAYLYAKDGQGNPYAPAWWTFNIKSSIKLVPGLQLDVGLENFFDYRYRPYSSGICAPGRNFIIALRGKI